MPGMVKSTTKQRAVISVRGVVQGVGFRPFVYRWPRRIAWPAGCATPPVKLKSRLKAINPQSNNSCMNWQLKPPRCTYRRYPDKFLSTAGYTDFRIQDSVSNTNQYQLVSPTLPRALSVVQRFLTHQIAGSIMLSPTAPIAAPASRSSKIFPTTGRIRQCGISKCVPAVSRNMMTR